MPARVNSGNSESSTLSRGSVGIVGAVGHRRRNNTGFADDNTESLTIPTQRISPTQRVSEVSPSWVVALYCVLIRRRLKEFLIDRDQITRTVYNHRLVSLEVC